MDSLVAARDAFQERLLAALYKARAPGELILKGGVAMKVRNQGARFTKDLDLDHDPRRGLDSLIKSVRKAIDQAFGGGFKKLGVSEPKQTDTVARWKIQAAAPDGQEFQLTIEVSRRHEIDMEDVEASIFNGSDRGLARVYIDVYKADKLVEMKLRALLDEARAASRDIYDLDLLIAGGARPATDAIVELQKKHGDLVERAMAKMEVMPWALFESQTLPAIPDDLRVRVTEKEYGAMQERILTEIIKWTAQPVHVLPPVRANWDTRLELLLAAHDAAPVLNTATLFRLARHESVSISRASVERWITDACAATRLVKVVRGLYLNRMVSPAAELYEAAIWLRPACVVSLQTVLGDSGVWNNYTNIATAVVPFSSNGPRHSLGKRTTDAGEFQFRGMPESILNAGKASDRLEHVTGYLRATPEAALLHWLYLARSPHSNLTSPPLDVDLDELNAGRLRRLAKGMQIAEELESWMHVKREHDASQSAV